MQMSFPVFNTFSRAISKYINSKIILVHYNFILLKIFFYIHKKRTIKGKSIRKHNALYYTANVENHIENVI